MSGYRQSYGRQHSHDGLHNDDRDRGGRQQTRVDRPPLEWDTIGILRQHDRDRSPAAKLTVTKTGPVRISYTPGIMDGEGPSSSFRPIQHLPDRDITDYLELLRDAATRVGESVRKVRQGDQTGLRVSLGEVVRVR